MSTTYKGCTITRTEFRLSSSNPRENTRQLYAISGRLNKGAAPRPFLTSIKDAKDWINSQERTHAEVERDLNDVCGWLGI